MSLVQLIQSAQVKRAQDYWADAANTYKPAEAERNRNRAITDAARQRTVGMPAAGTATPGQQLAQAGNLSSEQARLQGQSATGMTDAEFQDKNYRDNPSYATSQPPTLTQQGMTQPNVDIPVASGKAVFRAETPEQAERLGQLYQQRKNDDPLPGQLQYSKNIRATLTPEQQARLGNWKPAEPKPKPVQDTYNYGPSVSQADKDRQYTDVRRGLAAGTNRAAGVNPNNTSDQQLQGLQDYWRDLRNARAGRAAGAQMQPSLGAAYAAKPANVAQPAKPTFIASAAKPAPRSMPLAQRLRSTAATYKGKLGIKSRQPGGIKQPLNAPVASTGSSRSFKDMNHGPIRSRAVTPLIGN